MQVKVDTLVGLKENVILGHLVPAGTGFHLHQDSEVRIRPEALEELQAEKEKIRQARLNLLGELGEAGDIQKSSLVSPAPQEPVKPEGESIPSLLDISPDKPEEVPRCQKLLNKHQKPKLSE